jgi:hypothetical protein
MFTFQLINSCFMRIGDFWMIDGLYVYAIIFKLSNFQIFKLA